MNRNKLRQSKRRTVIKRSIEFSHSSGKLTCFYCFRNLKIEEVSIDHVVPVSQGGSDKNENLVACCVGCNKKKGTVEDIEVFFIDEEKRRKANRNLAIERPRLQKRKTELKKYFCSIFLDIGFDHVNLLRN